MEQNKKTLILKSYLRFILSSFFCLVLMLFWVVFHDSNRVINDVVFGVCFILILVMVFADYGYKSGISMKNYVKFHEGEDDKKFGLKIGLCAMIPSYIGVVALLLTKFSIVKLPLWIYTVFNVYFYPIFDLTVTGANYETIEESKRLIVSSIPFYSVIIMAVLPLLIPVATQIAYSLSYNAIDLKTKIFYKNKK